MKERIVSILRESADLNLRFAKESAGDVEEARRLWTEARDRYEAVGVQEGVAESAAKLAQLGR